MTAAAAMQSEIHPHPQNGKASAVILPAGVRLFHFKNIPQSDIHSSRPPFLFHSFPIIPLIAPFYKNPPPAASTPACRRCQNRVVSYYHASLFSRDCKIFYSSIFLSVYDSFLPTIILHLGGVPPMSKSRRRAAGVKIAL